MTDNHTELCECDCLNHCGDDPDLSRRKARPCRSAIDWAHEQALAIEAERERQRKVDLFESQAARIQQQALEYVSLFDQCSEHLARIAELEKERDALKADAERWRIIEATLPTDELQDIAIIVAAEHSVNVANGFSKAPADLLDAAVATLQAEKETR